MIVRGGFYEQLEEHIGYAHAVEHMLSFYTSQKYPSTKTNEDTLSRLGIKSNAYTTNHYTGYWLTALEKNFIFMLDLMLCVFLYPHFDTSKFQAEKEAVKKELDRIINETWYSLETKIDEIIYNNTNNAISTKEEKANIERLDLNSIQKAHERFYMLHNMALIVVSNHSNKDVFKIIKNIVDIPENHDPTYYKLTSLPENLYKKHDIVFVPNHNVDNYRIKIVIQVPYILFDSSVYVLHVLDFILTDRLNSRLYRRLRDKLGAVYFVSGQCSIDPVYPELSNYTITTETTDDRVIDVIENIEDVLQTINDDPSLKNEVIDYRNKMGTNIALDELSRHPDQYTSVYIPYILWQEKLVSRQDAYDRLLNVSSGEVSQLASNLFTSDNIIIFYSGKKEL
jgi:predicted Zn-dependent peptidase